MSNVKLKQYERKHRHQVSPYGTLLSLSYSYPLGFLVCSQLCKSSCGLFTKHMGGTVAGTGRTLFPNDLDHYAGF